MAEKSIELRDAETQVATLMSERNALASKNATLELQLKERDGKLGALESEVITLRNDAKARAENDEKKTVDIAFQTYKDSHKLTDAHKVSMLLTLRHDPETFHKIYPEIAPANRHLMRDLANRQSPALQNGAGTRETMPSLDMVNKSPDGMIALKDKYVKEGMDPIAALVRAHTETAPLDKLRFGNRV